MDWETLFDRATEYEVSLADIERELSDHRGGDDG